MKNILFILVFVSGCAPFSQITYPSKYNFSNEDDINLAYKTTISYIKLSELNIKLDIESSLVCQLYIDSLYLKAKNSNLSFRHYALYKNNLMINREIEFQKKLKLGLTSLISPDNDTICFINNGLYITGKKVAIDTLVFYIDQQGDIYKLDN